MAIHILRDYLTLNYNNAGTLRPYIYSYLLTIFMRRVLGYSYIGDTNYPINAVGTLLIATGDTTPTSAPTFPPGNKAGINLGATKLYHVSIPAGIRVVSVSDINRLIVLKSNAYPTFNSGIFKIMGIDVSTNSYIIDYRTLGEPPPAEAADTLIWYLYATESSGPIYGNPNTKTAAEYRGDGNSATPRIMLQSPNALGWQARICCETLNDWNGGAAFTTYAFSPSWALGAGNSGIGLIAQQTVSPGFGGNAAGDFPVGGQHFHAPMFYNSSDLAYVGCAIGYGDSSSVYGGTMQYRITIVGDDTGQGVTMYCRRMPNLSGITTSPNSYIITFGLAENEPMPVPTYNAARLFCIGTGLSASSLTSGNGDNQGQRGNDGSLQIANVFNATPATASQGMSSATFGVPAMCGTSFWTYITGNVQGASPMADSFGADNPFVSSTELLPIDLMSGTLSNWRYPLDTASRDVLPIAPHTMGTIPHLRSGRANFGDFSPTTDAARSYQHLRRGIYIPWNGPNLIP